MDLMTSSDSIILNITTEVAINHTSGYNSTNLPTTIIPSLHPFYYNLSIAHIIQLVLCCILFVVGLIANSLVLIIYLATPSLKNPTNYYLMNLMLVDLIILCFNIPIVIITEIMQDNLHYTMGQTMCKLSQSVAAASVYIMSFILVAISLDRYMAVKHPLKRRLNDFWTAFVIIILWLCAFILVIPEFIYLEVKSFSSTMTLCTRRWPDLDRFGSSRNYMIYMICITFIGFIIPLIVMIFTNVQITMIVRRSGSIVGGATHNQRLDKTKHHVLVMVITIVIIYILCLTPKEVTRVLFACQLVTLPIADIKIMAIVVRYIAYANAAINPIIYAMLNKQFKARLYKILHWPLLPSEKANSSIMQKSTNHSIIAFRSSSKSKSFSRFSSKKSLNRHKPSTIHNGYHHHPRLSSFLTPSTEAVYLSPSEIDLRGLALSPTAAYV